MGTAAGTLQFSGGIHTVETTSIIEEFMVNGATVTFNVIYTSASPIGPTVTSGTLGFGLTARLKRITLLGNGATLSVGTLSSTNISDAFIWSGTNSKVSGVVTMFAG
jgi:hypothetical protein